MKVMILSDGVPGHFNQSKGVSKLIAEQINFIEEIKILEPKFFIFRSFIKILSRYLCKSLNKPRATLIQSFYKKIDIDNCDLIIAAGGNTAAFSAAISMLTGIPNIQLGSPRGIHSNFFNAHLTIERYFDTPSNIVLDITPNLYSPSICNDASDNLSSENSCLLLMGGNGIAHTYSNEEWEYLLKNIKSFVKIHNAELVIVTSRRTDSKIEKLFRKELFGFYSNRSIWFNLGGKNANLAKLLGNACKVFVTEDSTMMISESISSGKKVTTLYPKNIHAPVRYRKHIQKYIDLDLIDSQSISSPLNLELGIDNIDKINLIRDKLRQNILDRIGL